MLNIFLSIIILPFVPFIFWGQLLSVTNSTYLADFSQDGSRPPTSQQVLGEISDSPSQKEKVSQEGIEKCDLFPAESTDASYLPIRTPDFKDLKLWAGSSVAIDADSGTILHYDNGRKRTQIASLTKMMTAVLVLENIKSLDEEVTITSEALNVPGTVVGCPTSVFCNGNRLYRGEKVKARDLLKVMLLNSANDAATALGVHIAGSADKFVEMMNDKARSLGLIDTNFCTPSGLEIDGRESECYSSAYDIARIGVYSLRYNLIWDIMKIPEGEFTSVDGKYTHTMKNTDLLLGEIPNCLGGKTGFTPLAGKSLLMGTIDASRKHKVIAVLLNDENRWDDMRILASWIFNNYDWR